jgi:hypothetical protein
MLRAVFVAEGVPVDDPLLTAMIDQVGPEVPYFLQLMAKSVIDEHRRTNTLPTPSRVAALYEHDVLSARTRHNLEDYWERIDRVYTPAEANVVREVLAALSRRRGVDVKYATLRGRIASHGFDPAVLDRILPLMENDFYVRRDETSHSYAMFNRCLADWWRIYHGRP